VALRTYLVSRVVFTFKEVVQLYTYMPTTVAAQLCADRTLELRFRILLIDRLWVCVLVL